MNVEINANLKKFQKKLIKAGLDYSKRNLCVLASRQIGKSFSLRLLSILYLGEESSFIGYVTLTNKLGKLFYSEILKSLPKQIVEKANSVDLIIELVNGSKMQFFSIESIENVRGFSLTHLIIDETAFAREYTPDGQNIWQNILNPLIDAKGKKVIFCSTPWVKSGLFYESYNKALGDSKNWDLVKATIYDDETKTPEWIENKRSEMLEQAFKTEYCCEFVDENANSFFSGYSDLFSFQSSTFEFKDLYVGIDFSSVGNDETIVTFINRKGEVWQELIEGDLDSKYSKISGLLNKYSKEIISGYAENNSIGVVMFEEIKKKLVGEVRYKIQEFNTNSKSKGEILNFLQYQISKKSISFPSDYSQLLSQFNTFVYSINPNTKNISYGALPNFHDDRIISLALANMCRKEKTAEYTIYTY